MHRKTNVKKYETALLLLFIISVLVFAGWFYWKTGNEVSYHVWHYDEAGHYRYQTFTRNLNVYMLAQLFIVGFTTFFALYSGAKKGFCATYIIALGILLSFSTSLQVLYSGFEKQMMYMGVGMILFGTIIVFGSKILKHLYPLATKARKTKVVKKLVNQKDHIKQRVKQLVPAKVMDLLEKSIEQDKNEDEWNMQMMYFQFVRGCVILLTTVQVYLVTKSMVLRLVWKVMGKEMSSIPGAINGSIIWAHIGPFSYQPGEFLKLFLILYFAQAALFNGDSKDADWRILLLPSVGVTALVLSRDMGNASIILCLIIVAGLALWPRLNSWARIFTILLILGLFGVVFGGRIANISYITNRFDLVFHALTSGKESQLYQSLMSILKGGFWGIGLDNINYYTTTEIYASESDLAFNTFTAIFGVMPALVMVATFGILVLYGASETKSSYHSMVLGLTATVLFFQMFIHIGGNLNVFPFTGLCLPLISSGGSNTVSSLLMLAVSFKGLLQRK